MADNIVSRDVTAANQFTDWLEYAGIGEESFHIAVSGTFSATITLQYSRDHTEIIDVDTYTAPVAKIGDIIGTGFVRIGSKTAEFTSGTAKVSLNK